MGKVNLSKVKAKGAELKKGFTGNMDKLEAGKNVRRILFPKGDNEVFWEEGFVHFGLGSDGKKMVTCLETFGEGKDCPVCKLCEKLKKSSSKADKKLYDQIRRVKRTMIAVLNRDAEDEEEKPKILSVGSTIMKAVIDLICDPDYGDITDYKTGRDITITKTGKGMETEYSVIAKPKTSVASEEYTEEELEELIPDLKDLFPHKTAEEIEAIMNDDGEAEDDDESLGDKESPDYALDYTFEDLEEMNLSELKAIMGELKLKMPVKVTRSRLVSLIAEALELDTIEDDEEEEEPPVKNKSKGKAKEVVVEEEDDETDGEDDEEDEDDDVQAEIQKRLAANKK